MTTYQSRAFTISDGVTAAVPVPFPYVSEQDVYVFDNGVAYAGVVTWLTGNSLSLAPIPLSGDTVEVRRQTVSDEVLAQIQLGVIRPADLNLDTEQLLFLIQEVTDAATIAQSLSLRLAYPLNGEALLPLPEPNLLVNHPITFGADGKTPTPMQSTGAQLDALVASGGGSGGGTSTTAIFASKYATLALADAAAGASGTVIMDPQVAFTVSGNMTLVAKKYVWLGGTIAPGSHNLTFTNAKAPPDHTQAFVGPITGLITWTGRSGVIYAGSYGVVADDSTPNAVNMQAAHASVKAWPQGGVLETPAGDVNIEASLTFDASAGSLTTLSKGFELRGESGTNGTKIKSSLTSGTMMTCGHAASGSAPGVCIKDITFGSYATPLSGSGEALLLNLDYCIDAHLYNVNAYGGFGQQVYIGRPQGTRWFGGRLQGYFESGTYCTSGGLALGVDSQGNNGQDANFFGLTIRDHRTLTHSGISVDFRAGGGSEHKLFGCEIENADCEFNIDQNSVSLQGCQGETRSIFYSPAIAAGGNTGTGTLAYPAGLFGMLQGGLPANVLINGNYVAVANGSGGFSVTDPHGNSLAGGTVGTPYNATLTLGSPQFTLGGSPVNGDTFTIPGAADVGIRVGHAGSAVSFFRCHDGTFSMSRLTDALQFSMENYRNASIRDNLFDQPSGAHVSFSLSDNYTASIFADNINIDCVANVAFTNTYVDGKVAIFDNVAGNNSTPKRITLPVNLASPAPSIANAEVVVTANTAPTTYTQFVGLYPGKEFILITGDALTTITHGTNFFMKCGKTKVYPNAREFAFRCLAASTNAGVPICQEIDIASLHSPKIGTVTHGDAGVTLVPGVDPKYHLWNVPFTINHNVVLSNATAEDGLTEWQLTFAAGVFAAATSVFVKDLAGTTLATITVAGGYRFVFSDAVGVADYYLA